jgi:hypothetical protein
MTRIKFMRKVPKIYWWCRYRVGTKWGLLPKPFHSEMEAGNKAATLLHGAQYTIHPLATNLWKSAAKQLEATAIDSDGNSSQRVNVGLPSSDMRF